MRIFFVLFAVLSAALGGAPALAGTAAGDAWRGADQRASATAVALPESAFTFASDSGDYIGGGQSLKASTADSTFFSTFDGTSFHGSITPSTAWWYVDIGARPDEPLIPGAYENAVRWPFNGPGQPGLSVTGSGRGCNALTGRFVVTRANQATGEFEASFEQHCEGGTPKLMGQIRIGAPGADVLAPALGVPHEVRVETTGATARVQYAVSATDLDDPSPNVSCTPPSGSFLPIGTTTVTCTATDTAGNTTTRSFTVEVRAAPVGDPPGADEGEHALSMAVSRRTIRYGQAVAVTARLTNAALTSNRVLSIYARQPGRRVVLVARKTVDESGTISVRVRPARTTWFLVEWTGDDDSYARAAGQPVGVTAIVRSRVDGHRGTAGRYRVFRPGDVLRQVATVVPNHRGHRVTFVAEERRSGRWAAMASAPFRLRANSSVTGFLPLRRTGEFRVRVIFRGDRDHLRATSPWSYARVR